MASTTLIGRTFEEHSLKFLNHHLNMSLRRIGGAGDEGIDLRGWWYVPEGAKRVLPPAGDAKKTRNGRLMARWDDMARHTPLPGWGDGGRDSWTPEEGWRLDDRVLYNPGERSESPEMVAYKGVKRLRVVGQCKAEKKPLSSRMVRDMEGVLAHFHGREAQLGPHQYNVEGRRLDRAPLETIGVLLSQAGFSMNATTRAWRSPSPLILVHLPGGRPNPASPGTTDLSNGLGGELKVGGCWWNPALSGLKGLFGGTMELRREILRDGELDRPQSSSATAEGDEDEFFAVPEHEKQHTQATDGGVRDQWRVWYKGKPLSRVGPSLEEALLRLGSRRDSD